MSKHGLIETITPEIAASYLKHMINNRPLKQAHTIRLAMSIAEGKWVLDGSPIRFNDRGEMIDGQHRCQACILADESFETYVIRDIKDPRAFATIDGQAPRSHADIHALAGIKDYTSISSMSALVYYYRHKMIISTGITSARTAEYKAMIKGTMFAKTVKSVAIDKTELVQFTAGIVKGLAESLKITRASSVGKLLPVSQVAGMHYLFSEKSRADAGVFVNDFGRGSELANDDPVLVLRNKIISHHTAHAHLNKYAVLYLMAMAWNKRRRGERSKQLKIVDGSEFPKII